MLRKISSWLDQHPDAVVSVIVIFGFVFRVVFASSRYLDGDNSLIYLIANRESLLDVYRASLYHSHPPLFYVLLYYWPFLRTSQLALQLPTILAGTALIWVSYRWASLVFSRTAGLLLALLIAILPELIYLSGEVRQYSVLLFFMVCSLHTFERGVKQDSRAMLLWSAAFLASSILTHYSALWFFLAFGCYCALRLLLGQKRFLSLRYTWLAGQILNFLLFVALYFSHIKGLKEKGVGAPGEKDWLKAWYYHPEKEDVFSFALRSTSDLFNYLASSQALGRLTLFAFLAACLVLALGRTRQIPDPVRARLVALLLLLPFLIGLVGGISTVYPYGGSRQSVYLGIFVCAGLSFILAEVMLAVDQHIATTSVLLIVTLGLLIWGPQHAVEALTQDKDLGTERWSQSIGYLTHSLSKESILLVDEQTSYSLRYYADRESTDQPRLSHHGFWEASILEHTVVISQAVHFGFESLRRDYNGLRNSLSATEETPVWIVFADRWRQCLAEEIAKRCPEIEDMQLQTFGSHICVFRLMGPMDSCS